MTKFFNKGFVVLLFAIGMVLSCEENAPEIFGIEDFVTTKLNLSGSNFPTDFINGGSELIVNIFDDKSYTYNGYRANMTGGSPEKLTDASDFLEISIVLDKDPSESKIVHNSNYNIIAPGIHEWRLVLQDLSTKDTTIIREGSFTNSFAVFNDDGSKIVYNWRNNQNWYLFIYDVESRQHTTLYESERSTNRVIWSHDGDGVIFGKLSAGKWSVFYSQNMSTPIDITRDPEHSYLPVGIGASNEVILITDVFGGSELARIDINGSNLTRLSKSQDIVYNANVLPNGEGAFVAMNREKDSQSYLALYTWIDNQLIKHIVSEPNQNQILMNNSIDNSKFAYFTGTDIMRDYQTYVVDYSVIYK